MFMHVPWFVVRCTHRIKGKNNRINKDERKKNNIKTIQELVNDDEKSGKKKYIL